MSVIRPHIEKIAVAYLQPDKIIIVTMNIRDPYQSTFYVTNELSNHKYDISDLELGNSITAHLQLSKTAAASMEEMKVSWQEFIKKTKFKSEKAFIQYAKRVTVLIGDNKIFFEPYKNKTSDKVFLRIPELISNLSQTSDANLIGQELRRSWEKCFFI